MLRRGLLRKSLKAKRRERLKRRTKSPTKEIRAPPFGHTERRNGLLFLMSRPPFSIPLYRPRPGKEARPLELEEKVVALEPRVTRRPTNPTQPNSQRQQTGAGMSKTWRERILFPRRPDARIAQMSRRPAKHARTPNRLTEVAARRVPRMRVSDKSTAVKLSRDSIVMLSLSRETAKSDRRKRITSDMPSSSLTRKPAPVALKMVPSRQISWVPRMTATTPAIREQIEVVGHIAAVAASVVRRTLALSTLICLLMSSPSILASTIGNDRNRAFQMDHSKAIGCL